MRGLVVGVDVGNSKTHVAVADADGSLRGVATGPGWITGDLTSATVVEHVLDLIERACGRRTGFAAAAWAMAGLDLPDQERSMAARVAATGLAAQVTVVNDTFAVLRAGEGPGDGVAVVAGAGINCVGVRGDRVVRFHSMGRLSGDWGGGYDVGGEGLAMACRAEDGRDPDTLLRRRVPEHFGLARPLEVTEAVMTGRIGGERLAELAPVVFAAAAEGDSAASSIVRRLGREVGAFARAALGRLAWAGPPAPLVLGGGLLGSGDPLLLACVHEELAGLDVEPQVSDVPPVVGSVRMALDLVAAGSADSSELVAAIRRDLGQPSGPVEPPRAQRPPGV
jgi:N-acetylglucosamine kinase-like BadF-type ATPase